METKSGATSVVGGGSWYDATDRKWYMFATELADHCGMDTWTTNSRTIRASSASADGLYEREAVVVPIWSHEVEVTRGDNGEYVAGLQKFGGRNGFPPPEKNELVLFIKWGGAESDTVPFRREPNTPF